MTPPAFDDDDDLDLYPDYDDDDGNTGCPLCYSDEYIQVDGYERGEIPVYRCDRCGEEWS